MAMNFGSTGLSPAGLSLGLGQDLADQVTDQAEELRKKRMQEARQRALLGVTGSAAGASLFGLGSILSGG